MSDVIISRRGQQQRKSVLITEYITENQNWTMPEYAANNEVSVRIFGGGGGGYPCGGGGSGWMNNDVITLTPGEEVPITIGLGGNPNGWSADVGGVTSFGTYLSANGGGNQSKGGAGGYSANKMRYESTDISSVEEVADIKVVMEDHGEAVVLDTTYLEVEEYMEVEQEAQ